MTDHLLRKVEDGVATLTMNRPDSLNSLSGEMNGALVESLHELAVDPEVGCIVLTGAGRGFCSGGDVSGMAAGGGETERPPLESRINTQRAGQEISRLLNCIPKVTLAAINGAAAGAGLGIALACDMRVASASAKFATAFARVGYGGDYGITWGLTHTVGPAKAKELLFLSDKIDAHEAHRIGLVNQVLVAEEFESGVAQIAQRLAAGPQVSFRWMKENVNLAVSSSYHAALDREAFTHLRCGETEDHREGVRAFMEKRAPQFKGR